MATLEQMRNSGILNQVIDGLDCCKECDAGLCDSCPYVEMPNGKCQYTLCSEAMKILYRVKNDDVVTVVRCKDCKYWKANNAEEGDWSGVCCGEGFAEGADTEGFDFCSEGVEKDD